MYDDEEGDQGPRGTYEIYRAEGDLLTKSCQYKKAIKSYTTALELNPGDNDCLVSRSRCYLLLGDPNSALLDVEACLSDQPTYHKGLYQKAEALYFKGEFELALMFYHRGHRMRPELEEFRLGIQKAREAIQNSVGSPERVKLTKEGDLSYFDELAIGEPKQGKKGKSRGIAKPTRSTVQAKPQSAKNDPYVKKLLGELYGDRVYLEELLKDPVANSGSESDPINSLVVDGIKYLDNRCEFWRQQKSSKIHPQEKKQSFKDAKTIFAELETIEELQSNGYFNESRKRAEKLIKGIEYWGTGVPKESTLGNLYSCIGNTYYEDRDYNKAEDYFRMELSLGEMHNLPECRARGNYSLARILTSKGSFQEAVPYWRASIVDVKDILEQAWIYHELGRCLLEIGNDEEALDCSKEALYNGRKANDSMWQLNASVLQGQIYIKLGEYDEAMNALEEALDFAKIMKDDTAKKAIRNALNNLRANNTAKEEDGKKEEEKEEQDPPVVISATVQEVEENQQ